MADGGFIKAMGTGESCETVVCVVGSLSNEWRESTSESSFGVVSFETNNVAEL